jgi:hypothetical protein
MNGDVSGSRLYMSPAPSVVVQFLYFGDFSRLFLANFVLMIPDGDIFSHLEEMFRMFHTWACSLAGIFLHRGEIQRIPWENSLEGDDVPLPWEAGDSIYTRLHRTCDLHSPKHPVETRDVVHDLLVGLFVLFPSHVLPSWSDRYHHLLILPLILCNPPLEQPNEDLTDKYLFGSVQNHWNLNKCPRLVV